MPKPNEFSSRGIGALNRLCHHRSYRFAKKPLGVSKMQSAFSLFVFADSLAGRASLRVDAARCRPAASARLSRRSLRARARRAARHAALHMVHHFLPPAVLDHSNVRPLPGPQAAPPLVVGDGVGLEEPTRDALHLRQARHQGPGAHAARQAQEPKEAPRQEPQATSRARHLVLPLLHCLSCFAFLAASQQHRQRPGPVASSAAVLVPRLSHASFGTIASRPSFVATPPPSHARARAHVPRAALHAPLNQPS